MYTHKTSKSIYIGLICNVATKYSLFSVLIFMQHSSQKKNWNTVTNVFDAPNTMAFQ